MIETQENEFNDMKVGEIRCSYRSECPTCKKQTRSMISNREYCVGCEPKEIFKVVKEKSEDIILELGCDDSECDDSQCDCKDPEYDDECECSKDECDLCDADRKRKKEKATRIDSPDMIDEAINELREKIRKNKMFPYEVTCVYCKETNKCSGEDKNYRCLDCHMGISFAYVKAELELAEEERFHQITQILFHDKINRNLLIKMWNNDFLERVKQFICDNASSRISYSTYLLMMNKKVWNILLRHEKEHLISEIFSEVTRHNFAKEHKIIF